MTQYDPNAQQASLASVADSGADGRSATGATMATADGMACNGCGTTMTLDRIEQSKRARTSWHRCPLCRKVRLTSQPARLTESARSTTLDPALQDRTGFGEYPAEPDPAFQNPYALA